MKNLVLTLSLFIGIVANTNAAGNAEAGKKKAIMCTACHGSDGNAPISIYPKLAGQHAAYIVSQLKKFKSGIRKDPIMAGMSAGLSEEDMADIAAFFSLQKNTSNNNSNFPPISTQHANFIAEQLKKQRNNDPKSTLENTVKKLSDADIDALSKYLSDLSN